MEKHQLAQNVFIGPQISGDDLICLRNEGFTDVICNRPDEEHSEGMTAQKLGEIAARLGLSYHYHPVAMGSAFDAAAEKLGAISARPNTKVFAYCRTGARSSKIWELSNTCHGGFEARNKPVA